jgi:excisionase family DNA binding protein
MPTEAQAAPSQPDDILSAPEAAAIVGVTDDTMRRWAKEKRVRHTVTPSGRVRFRREDVEALLRPVEPETTEPEAAAS